MPTLSPDQQEAFDMIVNDHRTLFLTGEAGAGKSWLVNHIQDVISRDGRRVHMSAPTGVAASHIGGVTVFRMFGILPSDDGAILKKRCRQPEGINRKRSLFVIDEVSMLRVDLLELIDTRLRMWGDDSTAFGGFQVLFVGDWLQIPPVVTPREFRSVKRAGLGRASGFPFTGKVWRNVRTYTLTTQHRQSSADTRFKSILNDMRNGTLEWKHIHWMNENFQQGPAPRRVIRLCNTRKMAAKLNKALQPEGEAVVFESEATGSYERDIADRNYKILPAPFKVRLTVGTRVMFRMNVNPDFDDYALNLVNGHMGTVLEMNSDRVLVHWDKFDAECWVDYHKFQRISGYEDVWSERDGEMVQRPIITGTFEQLPLIVAHAITAHKCQGLTLDEVEIVMDPKCDFAPPGMLYVMVSRCTSFKGVWLKATLLLSHFRKHKDVVEEEARVAAL